MYLWAQHFLVDLKVQPEVENLKVSTPITATVYYICMMSIKQEVVTLAKRQKLMKRFQWLSLTVRCIFVVCVLLSTGWLKINTPPDNMQYLRNQLSKFKNY